MKECRKCGVLTSDYYVSQPNTCKACIKAYAMQYYTDNREARLVRMRVYGKEHYSDNREYYTNKNRAWKANNRERANELSRERNRRNYSTEANRVRMLKRRAMRMGNGCTDVSAADLREIKQQPCLACGTRESITIEHLVPLARGGRHSIGNLAPLCKSCNSSKGSMLWIEWKYSNRPRALEVFRQPLEAAA